MAASATTATQLLLLPLRCRHSDKISAGRFSYVFPTTSSRKSLQILASGKDEPAPFNSQGEDVKYVAKLAGGSVLGAAVIKYGSALFPQITTPNILLALSMISAPVILALLLLINKSQELER